MITDKILDSIHLKYLLYSMKNMHIDTYIHTQLTYAYTY